MSDNQLNEFLITTARTLSQMALYSPEHPTVKGTINDSHRLLTSLLSGGKDLSLGMSEGQLIVNGQVPQGVSQGSLRPFVVLLNNFNLHSLSFVSGISANELVPFFNLAYRKDLKKEKTDVAAFLSQGGVAHIKVNQAKYTKVKEDEEVGGKGSEGGNDESAFRESVENLPLDQFLGEVIKRAVRDQKERALLFNRVSDLIRKEIERTVEKQTKILRGQKTVATNERVRTEGVVETVADGVVVVDESGCVLMMNEAAENIYGVKLGQCVGKPLWEGVNQEQMVALAKDLTVPSDRPLVKEVQLKANQDTQKTLRGSTAAVQDPNGRVVGMISVLSDVTKQRELTRMQNEFLANVTHDLRAPIHALKLAIAAIMEGSAGPISDEQKKMLSLANRNGDRLSRLINDLLDFTQIETGKLKIQPEITDITPVLSDAVKSFEAWSSHRGVTLKMDLKEKLPTVYADGDRLLQVINNLISNAIKFTPKDGQVTLRASKVDENRKTKVRIEIEDTGKGISKEDQRRVFGRFVQLKNEEKLDVRGTGLGLSICQALVQAHNGSLSLQSPPPNKPNGSLFYFEIPAVDRSTQTKERVSDMPTMQKQSPTQKKKGLLSRLLGKLGFSVILLLLMADGVMARPHWGHVRRVLEGDLIQLKDGTKVRYLGIDAPDRGSPYYAEALAANRGWVEGKEVRFRYGLQERDAKGVWQAYVFVDGLFVNYQLVLEGNALVARLSNDEKYLADLLKAERKAHKKRRGLWKDSVIDPYPVRIKQRDTNPWASPDEVKKGFKKVEDQDQSQ